MTHETTHCCWLLPTMGFRALLSRALLSFMTVGRHRPCTADGICVAHLPFGPALPAPYVSSRGRLYTWFPFSFCSSAGFT